MGGRPRSYPGGVSKWQWKQMQAKKAKQLLKARLRQIYEMRKRAELKAAVTELERPWEAVEKAPTLFSFSADEQLKVIVSRGPAGSTCGRREMSPNCSGQTMGFLPLSFFPKGVVHSIKPYGKVENFDDDGVSDQVEGSDADAESDGGARSRGVRGNRFVDKHGKLKTEISNGEKISALLSGKKHRNPDDRGKGSNTKFRNSYNRRNVLFRNSYNRRNVVFRFHIGMHVRRPTVKGGLVVSFGRLFRCFASSNFTVGRTFSCLHLPYVTWDLDGGVSKVGIQSDNTRVIIGP